MTTAQKALLARPVESFGAILLYTWADDRVAKNLAAKGLGTFVSFRSQYPWRRRDGYINHFFPKVS
jgi:hypothetical protein